MGGKPLPEGLNRHSNYRQNVSSVLKELDDASREELKKESAKKGKAELSAVGLNDSPAIFRKVGKAAGEYMKQYKDGSPNPERRILGGVLVKGGIERTITINLVALRGLQCSDEKETKSLRIYLLS